MDLVSRTDAIAAGLSRYVTGRPCPQGHVAGRFVSSRCCATCSTERAAASKRANPAKSRAQSRDWALRNPERRRAATAAWNRAHPEHQARRARKWYLANREKANANTEAWRQRNPARAAARQAKRRASLMLRTPPWADFDAITAIYAEAQLRRDCGESVEVDHVIPLQGRRVSGLHVHENLQIIPMRLNRSKANNFLEIN